MSKVISYSIMMKSGKKYVVKCSEEYFKKRTSEC